jgi:hypothetical protein
MSEHSSTTINPRSFWLLCIIIYFTSCAQSTADTENKVTPNQEQFVDSTWKGTWTRYMWQETAILEITAINKDSFVFDIEVGSGGRGGDFMGSAGISGDSALFLTTEDEDSCMFRFTRLGDSVILVKRIKGECGGAHFIFDGRYFHQKYFKEIEENLVTLDIMESATQDSVFRSLVGQEYQNFVNTTHLVSLEDDLDSSGSTVMVSGVRSLFTSMEYIIMTDSSRQIFAAAIIDGDDNVNYYTNWERFKGAEPKTIKFWRSRFMEKRFVFKQ